VIILSVVVVIITENFFSSGFNNYAYKHTYIIS